MSDQMQPCLFTAYDKTVRHMMDTVDKLREVGIDNDINLPQIVVIGDQSSGKSSTLEALSGVQLPRGSGIVTRCPLVLKLRRCQDFAHSCKIKYADKEIRIDELDMDEIGNTITKAQDVLAGKEKGISNKVINMEIVKAGVPDLTLIDLPGIARVPMPGQPPDIEQQTKKLIKQYIGNSAAIILVMAACNNDIATNEALNMAKEVDPTGERTLGVLTKADRIEPGDEPKILKLLRNVTKNEGANLPKGYTLIKCRTSQQLEKNTPLEEAVAEEERFFKENSMFRSDRSLKNKLGTENLARKLTTELQIHLRKSVPVLKSRVLELLRETEKEQAELGPPVPGDKAGRRERMIMVLTEYSNNACRIFEGNEVNPRTQVNLWSLARQEFKVFADIIEKVEPASQEKIRAAIWNQRGAEPSNFLRYPCCRKFLLEMLDQCQQPALDCMYSVFAHVDGILNDLAESTCYTFPRLLQEVKVEMESLGREEDRKARDAMNTLFKMEEVVFACDRRYSEELDAVNRKPHEVFFDHQVGEMRKSIIAHYNIIIKRLVDTVPMVILYHYFKLLPGKIGSKMIEMWNNPEMEQYLDEHDDLQERRMEINNKRERLEKAAKCLTTY